MFFTLGGGDANENAVRIARQASKKGRGLVVTRDRSYHGASYMDMALSGRRPHRAPGGLRSLGRAPRAAALRLPLPLRQQDRRGMRPARGRRSRRCDRQGRRGPRHRGDDGSRCRQQRHRAARQLLAGAASRHARARRVPDRGRGHERLRPLRRVVRLAALRRGEPPRPDDAREGTHRRVDPARRRRHQRGRVREARARDVLRRPHLLRPPALLRRRRRGRSMPTATRS